MLVLFRRFLTDALAIEIDEIVMSLNAYTNNGLSIEENSRPRFIIGTGPLAQLAERGTSTQRSASRETAGWSAAVCWDALRA
jgi:hypothetical protein